LNADFYNSAQSAVTYATTAAEVILLVRLAWLGLLREFKIFSIYLVFDAVRTSALSRWDYHTYGYEWVWTISVPLSTFLLAAASLELSHGLREPFPKETGNRITALYGFLIGMSVSAVASMLTHPQAISRSGVLLAIIGRRSILSGCILAILAQGAYLRLGDAPLTANWRLHRRSLLTYMTAIVIGLFAATAKHRQYAEWIYLLRSISLFGCFCMWTVGLRRLFSNLWMPSSSELPWGSEFPSDAQIAETVVFNRRARVALDKERSRDSKIRKPLLTNTKRREDPV
jgi:hypothetical protein